MDYTQEDADNQSKLIGKFFVGFAKPISEINTTFVSSEETITSTTATLSGENCVNELKLSFFL